MSNHVIYAAADKLIAASGRLGFMWLNKLIVSVYKVVGFALLTGILVGLVSYIARALFFMTSTSWIAPAILSPADDKILSLSAQLAAELSHRDELVANRRELSLRRAHEARIVSMEEAFLGGHAAALGAELAERRAELRRLSAVGAAYRSEKAEILGAHARYAEISRERLDELFDARLIDVDALVGGTYQRAQIAQSNLALEASSASLDTRIAELVRRVKSLEEEGRVVDKGAASGPAPLRPEGARAITYEALQRQHERVASVVEAERARAAVKAVDESLAAADAGIARVDRVIQSIKDSPYMTAVDRDLTIAFVPYDNLDQVTAGVPVYTCRVAFVWCHEVGQVVEVLGGEVQGQHPLPSRGTVRGRMVRMDLQDRGSAREATLYLGRPPLGI